jgi:uncharacterized membrane protein (DUF373 family)
VGYAMSYEETFHKAITFTLTALMGLVIFLATSELVYIIAHDILSPPLIILEIDELLDIFGYILLVLIGLELRETLRIYLIESALNVQVVLIVAMIAIARKIIILDYHNIDSLTLIGIGFTILSLSIGYYLVKKSQDSSKCKRL